MRVIVLFEPDKDCVDPKDELKDPRRHYDIVEPGQDAIVMWREYNESLNKDGYRTHVVGSGIFENVVVDGIDKALWELLSL